MRRHPVLFGILLLFCAGLAFFFLINILSSPQKGGYAFSSGSRVGVITVDGVITAADDTVREIEDFVRDARVKAIVIRIDSPGGGVAPTQEIYDAIREAAGKKKVVASMGSIAASGGYLLACAADEIVANPGTITGSISAIMHFADVQELMRKIGVGSSVVKSGKFKDIGSPVRDMTEEERMLIQQMVDDVYDQMLVVIADRRKMDREQLLRIADGRIMTGRQAHQAGLVDHLGNQRYAVRLAAKMAGIEGEPEAVYPTRKKAFLRDFLLESLALSFKRALLQDGQKTDGLNYLFRAE